MLSCYAECGSTYADELQLPNGRFVLELLSIAMYKQSKMAGLARNAASNQPICMCRGDVLPARVAMSSTQLAFAHLQQLGDTRWDLPSALKR